jgi:nucleotide-binding universal stress UspA family protein
MTTTESNQPSSPCIVVGFDYSPSGFDAVALARQLAVATDSRLVVAYIYLEGISAIEVVPLPEVIAKRRADAQTTVERARIILNGFERWEPIAYASEPAARGLHEVADAAGAELIVVGSTHRHGLGRVMPGATGERLLHGSACPIAIAPAGWRGDAIETIGAGFDGSPESRAALAAATSLACASGASLRALNVFEPPNPANPVYAVTGHGYTEIMGELRDERRARLDQALEELPSRVDAGGQVVDGHPAEVLAAESEHLDLLVIGSRGYGALRATLAGSVAHELAGTSRCPLLLVPRGVARPLDGLCADGDTARPLIDAPT